MKLLKTIKNLFWKRAFWALLFFIMVFINIFALLAFVSNNRNDLVFNPFIKAVLPLYRTARDMTNRVIDLSYVFKMRRNIGIPQYKLEVKTSDLRKLNEAIPSSVSDEVISGDLLFNDAMRETVKGKFYYGNKQYDVKVRYRGENANHWTRAKKSWQIKFDKDTPFNGLRTLKLVIPIDRFYFAEALNNYRAEKLGLFYPEAEFVQLYINNSYEGVYFAIEDFSSEFLEKNQKPPDGNTYAMFTDAVSVDRTKQGTSFDSIDFWRKETEDKIFDYENFAELDFLLKHLNEGDFSSIADDIIDMHSFYNWNIVALLAGSNHQSNWGNMRLYFNNAKGKFEFIPWDVGIKGYLPNELTNALTEKILSYPGVYQERNQRLWDYISNEENLADDLQYYDDLYNDLKGAFYSDFKKHGSNISFNNKVSEVRGLYESIFTRLQNLFAEDAVNLNIRHDASKKIITLIFDINSFAGLKLQDIALPGIAQLQEVVDQYLFAKQEVVEIRYTGIIDDASKIDVRLRNTVTGEEVKIDSIKISDLTTFNSFSDISKSVDDFIKKNPEFGRLGNNIVLFSGIHIFDRDVIIPKGNTLFIQSGTTIYFASGASLVSYSPVQAIGTAVRPIVVRALDPQNPWGSFAILNTADQKSSFEYVDISGGSSDYVNGVSSLGMVSVYYSDVEIRDSVFSESKSDDALNVKYADVILSENTFKNNSADGLDLDYATGEVSGNIFTDNGNDGIDLSGASVAVLGNRIERSGDKCISIGEKTKDTEISNNILDSCSIGVEVKDASSVSIIDSVIKNNKIGINAYLKKPVFMQGGTVEIFNSVFENNEIDMQKDEYSDIKIQQE